MLLEHGRRLAGRGSRRIAGELVLDRVEIEHLEDLSLIEGTLEAATVDDVGEVQEGTGDGGARDVVHDGAVVASERLRAMDVDARMGPARAPRNGDFDVRPVAAQEPVQRGGLAMAQDRTWTSGEHRGHPPSLAREQLGRDEGIDAAMDAMEASASGALAYRGARKAECRELIKPKHCVLLACDDRDRFVHRSLAEKRYVWLRFSATLGHQAMVNSKASAMSNAL